MAKISADYLAAAMITDVLGDALSDYYFNNAPGKLWVYDTIGERVEMDVAVYFRRWEDMPELEKIALKECGSKVLDIGAGAGSHSLELQKRGHDVTALDISPGAVDVMKARGVAQVIAGDIFMLEETGFDTLLLLMNGIGVVGNLDGLRSFLLYARTLLKPDGQLLFDSSDVAYLYEDVPMPVDRYYGEIECRYGYKRRKSASFFWLYVDFQTLTGIAAEAGWKSELLFEDDNDQYLVRLTRYL